MQKIRLEKRKIIRYINKYMDLREGCNITGTGTKIRDFNFPFYREDESVLRLRSHTRSFPIFEE